MALYVRLDRRYEAIPDICGGPRVPPGFRREISRHAAWSALSVPDATLEPPRRPPFGSFMKAANCHLSILKRMCRREVTALVGENRHNRIIPAKQINQISKADAGRRS
jgi:hypothetical protein